MRLIVGLGNPGKKYEHTKHNVGFDCLDLIAKAMNTKLKKSIRFNAEVAKERDYVLLKPLTYMNLSGNSIVKAMKYYSIDPEDVLVIYDDLDLPAGKIRIRFQGSSGGHNGMKSIIQHIGDRFNRVRIGVGRNANVAVVNDVLGKLSKADRAKVNEVIENSKDASIDFINNMDVLSIMNKYN